MAIFIGFIVFCLDAINRICKKRESEMPRWSAYYVLVLFDLDTLLIM